MRTPSSTNFLAICNDLLIVVTHWVPTIQDEVSSNCVKQDWPPLSYALITWTPHFSHAMLLDPWQLSSP
jgi:hypothetical protein